MMNSGSIQEHKWLVLYNKGKMSGHFLHNEAHRKHKRTSDMKKHALCKHTNVD